MYRIWYNEHSFIHSFIHAFTMVDEFGSAGPSPIQVFSEVHQKVEGAPSNPETQCRIRPVERVQN